jgi:hypothetical protein
MKDKILKLREQGKTYTEIQNELGCSRSLIAYHVNPLVKKKSKNRLKKNRFLIREQLKIANGGECMICGYSKCIAALQFHHREPKDKKFSITDFLWGKTSGFNKEDFENEVLKCDLVCSNCHAEIHYPDYIED